MNQKNGEVYLFPHSLITEDGIVLGMDIEELTYENLMFYFCAITESFFNFFRFISDGKQEIHGNDITLALGRHKLRQKYSYLYTLQFKSITMEGASEIAENLVAVSEELENKTNYNSNLNIVQSQQLEAIAQLKEYYAELPPTLERLLQLLVSRKRTILISTEEKNVFHIIAPTQMYEDRELAKEQFRFILGIEDNYKKNAEPTMINCVPLMKYLHFADCSDNQNEKKSLFIDYTLSQTGIKGQIIQYDESTGRLQVIASGIESFLS